MKPSGSLSVLWAGCWCVCLAAVSAQSETDVYGKVGDKVVLTPGPVSETITGITWRDNGNIAMSWDGTDIEAYRHFEERGHLNTSTGEMTITGLSANDSGLYRVVINTRELTPQIRLTVISPVPVPTVNTHCDDETTSCMLTCDGNTAGAEPVNYTWTSDDKVMTNLKKDLHVMKEDSSSIKAFSCELKNPVSQQRSQPILNPFMPDSPEPPEVDPKVTRGIIVFVILLASVMLLAVVHRCKAGVWFYEKESLPFQAEFWRNEKKKKRAKDGEEPAQETREAEETLT